ncbi:hypothetical protein SIID45300_01681 [Candidatus Magnetaquicoccaceae bacterium FCR-1]|uniref:KAP NTPase domain-containing protein n=1 Tax=Candidatus Magnetaquiglobus chichijimensis TaxID=3141448 RepID=A0ABQ0C8Z3_9PROT
MAAEPVTLTRIRSLESDPETPFMGDLFGRRQLAERLTGMVERMADGYVIGIDAPWGDGKTWFARHWAADLRNKGFRVAYIDAFKQDYAEDPFLMVCSELLSAIKSDESSYDKVMDAGKRVAKALLPAAAKAAVNIVGRSLLGTMDLSDELKKVAEGMEMKMADAVEKHFAKRLEAHAEEKKSVEGFASVLTDAAATSEKPIIVFVDELDRCRPDFAVRTVERIKHFFDVPKVVFVLIVNREQLESSIKGVYGQGLNAGTYLGKFVQLWLRLPKMTSLDSSYSCHNRTYCDDLAQRFRVVGASGHKDFQDVFITLANITGLSLRDLERGYTLFSFGQPFGALGAFAAWAIWLKLKHPKLFAGVMAGQPDENREASKIASELKTLAWFKHFKVMHDYAVSGDKTLYSQELINHTNRICFTSGIDSYEIIPYICKAIDLTVD